MTGNDEKFHDLCYEFTEKALADDPFKSPALINYMSEVVRATFSYHMWRLLDEIDPRPRR